MSIDPQRIADALASLDYEGPRLPQTVDGLRARKVMQQRTGRRWAVPRPYGPDGWWLTDDTLTIIVSAAEYPDGQEWVHASMTGPERVPTYEELTWLHEAVFGDGYAYQQFVPRSSHVNIHANALHLWGRADGAAAMPDFGSILGSI